jgi:hypothetical protein
MLFDSLRPPLPFDGASAAYKDWLHLNLLDHASGSVGLINVSLHGAPEDPRSRAMGVALLHVPGSGWIGNVEIRGMDEARIGRASIALERVALAVHHSSRTVAGSARLPEDGLLVRLEATAAAPAIVVEERLPLGPGWISWYALPRLTVRGHATIRGERVDLAGASAYHDHNWGRWHWGDDLGWDWGTFMTPGPGPAFVLTRTTDRSHRRKDEPMLVVQAGDRRRTFVGPGVKVTCHGRLDGPLRRLPGALAALHQDRSSPRLPGAVLVTGSDGVDRVVLEFRGSAAAQLVAADPAVRGYGFIHTIVGAFRCEGRLGGLDLAGGGLGVFEHVD